MVRSLLFDAVIFLGVIILTLEAQAITSGGCGYTLCSYTGDPHLIPFSQPYTQYWCQKPGWELLLSNQYVTIYVLVDHLSSYFRIIDYMLIFPGPPSCTTFGSSSNSIPCSGSASPVLTSLTGTSRIYIHKTQCLTIKINKVGSYYDFYIWQSPSLVEQSCGVCVKWNCSLEQRYVNPLPIVSQICDNFIQAAQAFAISPINSKIVDVAQTSCVNDIQLSFETGAAKTVTALVLQDGIEDLLDGGATKSLFKKIEQLGQNATQEAIKKTNELLKTSEPVCNEEKKCLEPLKS